MRDPVQAILRYNRRFRARYPQLLRRKIALLYESPFLFYRGTFHLFAADWVEGHFDPWPKDSELRDAEIRICADVHSENFGTYEIDHHRAAYGINDFDDATRGRLDFDACRCAASLLLAASRRGIQLRSAGAAAHAFVETYTQVLAGSRPPPDAPPIRRLLEDAQRARRPDYVRKRTVLKHGRRLFRGPRYFPLRPEHREQALRLLADYLGRHPRDARRNAGFFEVDDVRGRIAGCGSLGLLRYVILLRGEGSKEARNAILEFKEAKTSALDEARGRGRDGNGRAEFVIGAIRRFQKESDPFLGFAVDGSRSFQVRQLGPRDARLDGDAITEGHLFREISASFGVHLAAAQRRANPGLAALFRRIAGSRAEGFIRRTMSFALAYAQQAEEDWRAFVRNRSRVTRELLRD
ncbi:MAG TPA: DUF2252 family protein [Planctomycetota bacterium]|nr:DUF2252 family protein [Planctomycetota bacterium]